MVFDVNGYFTPDSSGYVYHPLAGVTVLDTRTGIGLGGPFSSHVSRGFQLRGVGGVPLTAMAVTGYVSATRQSSHGFLYIGFSRFNDPPLASVANFPVGDSRGNGVVSALDPSGYLWVTYAAPTLGPTAHAVFIVTGYFEP